MPEIEIYLPKDPVEEQLCREVLIEMLDEAFLSADIIDIDQYKDALYQCIYEDGFWLDTDRQYLYYSKSRKRIREYKIFQILE